MEKGKLWTNAYTNMAKTKIDYNLINKKWINSALNCEAYSSFKGASTDHQIFTAKIRLSLRRNATRTTKTAHYDWSRLNNRDISNEYTITLRNKFNALQEISEILIPNDEYENFVNVLIGAAARCIPIKSTSKHRVPWETLAVRKKRDFGKTASL